jgi:ribose transport system substrate-binding protein
MIKKVSIILLSLAMIFSLVACSSGGGASDESGGESAEESTEGETESGDSGKKLVLSKVPLSLNVGVHQADAEWEKIYSEEAGAEYIVIDGKADPVATNNAMDNLIAQGVDGIIVNPVDTAAIVESVKKAREEGISIVTYYRTPDGMKLPWVRVNEAENAYQMGVDVATKWKEFYPDKPIKIAIIEFLTSPITIEMRSKPFKEGVWSIDPDAEVVVELDGDGNRERSMQLGQDILQSHPEVNIIYGTSADQSLGCLAAFEAAGRGKAVDGKPKTEFFCGTDASQDELLKLVNPNSSLKFTMGMTPKENAKTQIDTLLKVINGEIPADEETIIDVHDKNFNYFTDSVDDIQAWSNDEYNTDWDLKGEVEKMKNQ